MKYPKYITILLKHNKLTKEQLGVAEKKLQNGMSGRPLEAVLLYLKFVSPVELDIAKAEADGSLGTLAKAYATRVHTKSQEVGEQLKTFEAHIDALTSE